MARLLGIVLVVLCVWVAAEVFTKGVGGAFGGVFAGFVESDASGRIEADSVPVRAADRYRNAHQRGVDRVEEKLGE